MDEYATRMIQTFLKMVLILKLLLYFLSGGQLTRLHLTVRGLARGRVLIHDAVEGFNEGNDDEDALDAALDNLLDCFDTGEEADESDDVDGDGAMTPELPAPPQEPNSFSKARAPVSKDAFPELIKQPRVTVEIQAGDMLYLPCGWFHEVTSCGLASSSPSGSTTHMAFNYWFHPPSNLENPNQPYESGYWEDVWTGIGLERQINPSQASKKRKV